MVCFAILPPLDPAQSRLKVSVILPNSVQCLPKLNKCLSFTEKKSSQKGQLGILSPVSKVQLFTSHARAFLLGLAMVIGIKSMNFEQFLR